MKKIFFIFIFFIFFIFLFGSLVSAICSLGASPLEMQARAKPGQIVEITWNFFNLRGDRATHVLVSKTEGADWEISYEPEAGIKQYEVSGMITDSNENFAMDKSEVVTIKPEPLPEGKVAYVVHPDSSLGYILVDKQIRISIEVPEDAEIGKEEEFVFEAIGKCFGETGSVSASLATELKVKITPTTDYYEKPVTGEKEKGISKLTGAVIGGGATGIFVVTILILLIVVLALLVKLKKRKIRSKGKTRNIGKKK